MTQHIKSDSKNVYTYVRSKQNVRDKVGPLEDNAGNNNTGIFIGRGGKYPGGYPETKFSGPKTEMLGQLIVTPEVEVGKISTMKENESPVVYGISPKTLKETVEQIRSTISLCLPCHLQEAAVHLEWKETNIIPLFYKGLKNKTMNY